MTPDDQTHALAETERWRTPFTIRRPGSCDAYCVVDSRGAQICECTWQFIAEEIARALNERWGRLGL